jgi:C4-dicarboxylate-specific signal transduction histidine kinase
MNKHYRNFIFFIIVIVSIISAKLYLEYKEGNTLSRLSIKSEAKDIADFLVAFRTTYQDVFIKNGIILDKTNMHCLPVSTTNQISKMFSSLNIRSKIATVSNRPRNPKNQANKRQLEAINYFNHHKNTKYIFKQIEDKYYYSKPLYITKTCLKCHGMKKDAPKIIQKNYDQAYDYKIGDLRGIIDIELSQTKFAEVLTSNNKKRLILAALIVSFILFIIFLYVRYNKQQEEYIKELYNDLSIKNRELEKSEHELEHLTHNLELKVQQEIKKNQLKDQQMLHQSRLAQMGEMISMIAHQWRQPLAAISSTSSALNIQAQLDKTNKDDILLLTDKISNLSQHLSYTIDDFRNFFKDNKTKTQTTSNKLINGVLSIVEVSLINKNIQLDIERKCNKPILTFENEVKQVLLNLIKNAEDILIEKEIKNPKIKIVALDTSITVSDNGGGVPSDIIDKIFDPYFSTKTKKDGTGLGLYMSKTIIEDHCKGKLLLH